MMFFASGNAAVSPGLAIVLGQVDLAIVEPEGLIAALRTDVGPSARQAIPEVVGLASLAGAAWSLETPGPSKPPTAAVAWPPRRFREIRDDCKRFVELVGG